MRAQRHDGEAVKSSALTAALDIGVQHSVRTAHDSPPLTEEYSR